MIEIIMLLSFMFLIYVFFYKQTINEYSINQIEFTNISTKLQDLLYDKIPTIIRNAPIANCVLPSTFMNTQRFKKVLEDYLTEKDINLPKSSQFESFIANESGFQVFSEHSWLSYLQINVLSKYTSSLKTKISFGSHPLVSTTAIYTILIPIKGEFTCSLINNEFTKYLPKIPTVTIEDISKSVQYIDVLLKPTTLIILPPHWHYIMNETLPYSYYASIEYHEPISLLMNYLEKKE
jgi:hypothetical protein